MAVAIDGAGIRMPRPGERVELSAQVRRGGVAADPASVSWQWQKDGYPIPGARKDTLLLDPVAPGDAGVYRVLAASEADTAFSPAVDLETADEKLQVTTLKDDGLGSLREVLAEAQGREGTVGITFQLPGDPPWTIQLLSPLAPVTTAVTILGPEGGLTLDGGGVLRPLAVDGGTLVLDGFTVANGLAKGGNGPGGGGGGAGMGGALFINRGSVTLRAMTFEGNRAVGGTSWPGTDGENGGGGGFQGDPPATGGAGAEGGWLGGLGGDGHLDGTATWRSGGGPALGDGAGGGAARGGLLSDPLALWADNLPGGDGDYGAGGGFSVGPEGGGGNAGLFGGGGGGCGGSVLGVFLPGSGGGAGGAFGGDGGAGDGLSGGRGGGGAGCGGAVFLRQGSLDLELCVFRDNTAEGGDGAQSGLGKGGALFVESHDPSSPFHLAMLETQVWENNLAGDPVEDPAWDNPDFYVTQEDPLLWRGSALKALYDAHRRTRETPGRP